MVFFYFNSALVAAGFQLSHPTSFTKCFPPTPVSTDKTAKWKNSVIRKQGEQGMLPPKTFMITVVTIS